MIKYQIIIQDEFNDLYHIGFYDRLEDSLKDINSFLLDCYDVTVESLDLQVTELMVLIENKIKIGNDVIYIKGFVHDWSDNT